MEIMLRSSRSGDLNAILSTINDAAECYRDVIPQECWSEPYMEFETLRNEIVAGVSFTVAEVHREILGVMGTQNKGQVILIRHAYVARNHQKIGIGTLLLKQLLEKSTQEFLIGTWSRAVWAISFYQKFLFEPLPVERCESLLRKYWTVPESQIENSVVLARPTFSEADSEPFSTDFLSYKC